MHVRQQAGLLVGAVVLAAVAGCYQDKSPTAPRGEVFTCVNTGTLTIGGTTTGDLGAATCRFVDSTRIQAYALTVTQTTPVDFAVDASNGSFDPLLLLYRTQFTDTAGVIALADNDPADTGSVNTRLHVVLAPGSYVLAVNHRYPPQYGAYSLTTTRGTGSAEFCQDPGSGLPSLWVTPGTTSQQTISTTDCTDGSSFADFVGVYLTAGQPVTISTTSVSTDTRLYVYDSQLNPLAQDDNSGGGINARLTITAPATGFYFMLIAAPPGITGEYTLTVANGTTSGASPAASASAMRSGQAAAASGWSAWLRSRSIRRAKSAL